MSPEEQNLVISDARKVFHINEIEARSYKKPYGPEYWWSKEKEKLDAIMRLLGALPAGIGALPLMLMVKASDIKSPAVVYIPRTISEDGDMTVVPKIRSMKVGADQDEVKMAKGLPTCEVKNGKDDRVTRIGGALRTTSLDELLQVIWGWFDPRWSPQGVRILSNADWAAMKNSNDPRVREYRKVLEQYKPPLGLTGPYGIYGRARLPFELRCLLEMWYVLYASRSSEITTYGRTVPAVVRRMGAK